MMVFPRRGGFWLEAFGSAALLSREADDLLADLAQFAPDIFAMDVLAGDLRVDRKDAVAVAIERAGDDFA